MFFKRIGDLVPKRGLQTVRERYSGDSSMGGD